MTTALCRAALATSTNRNAKWRTFSKLFNPRHHSSSAKTASSRHQCASVAEQFLLSDEALSAPTPLGMMPDVLRPRVVVYDGVCHLCHAAYLMQKKKIQLKNPLCYLIYCDTLRVKWIIRADKDRKIKFCCLQSNAAEPYMIVSGLTREDVLRRFLFVEGPGSYHQGSAAALRVLSYLPLPYSALSSLMIIPAPLRDAIYDYVAKKRYDWFGKGDDCLVLKETELLERFIDWEELLERIREKQL
ncbi:RNase H domain-containing protein [Striga asiatica]|uniref:RNase H domain-containing protein n=1 Tax=Striga asiatica TaxID=4170 RepID=A0A5A7RBH1_STRAF|nr:RNase H domain-containing protein [Striga asiatica]